MVLGFASCLSNSNVRVLEDQGTLSVRGNVSDMRESVLALQLKGPHVELSDLGWMKFWVTVLTVGRVTF